MKAHIDKLMGGRIREKDTIPQSYIQYLINNSTINWSQLVGDPATNIDLKNYIDSQIGFIYSSFTVPENQLSVGTIDEVDSFFKITTGQSIFDISPAGVITFKVPPDYETQSLYNLEVRSSWGYRYRITVNVTDVISLFSLNINTVLNLNTAI